jgi:hypothetical protein
MAAPLKAYIFFFIHKNWETFCGGIDKFTNPSYKCDRMKRLKCRYNKTEREHEYIERLVISAKRTFEKLCLGAGGPMQAPAFDHDNQDSFLDA